MYCCASVPRASLSAGLEAEEAAAVEEEEEEEKEEEDAPGHTGG